MINCGLISLRTSQPIPNRSRAPGRKFCTTTSAIATSPFNRVLPSSALRSRAIDRLLRFIAAKNALTPCADSTRGPALRTMSGDPGCSTTITSAPWSARIDVPNGPETTAERSMTRMPRRGPPSHSPDPVSGLFAASPMCSPSGHLSRTLEPDGSCVLRCYQSTGVPFGFALIFSGIEQAPWFLVEGSLWLFPLSLQTGF